MKAAVINELGQAPRYLDFPDPVPANDQQVVIRVLAASVKNLDKGRADGSHYARHTNLPEVVGIDGVGELPDGSRVYATAISGMIAEKALIDKNRYSVVPGELDNVTAAALPNAVMGAALALKSRGGLEAGQTVLINGATGVTGQAAVQIARHYGAKHIIATGRNPESLKLLQELGADEVISLTQDDKMIIEQVKKINGHTHIDLVIDYTWGHPAELLLEALKGGGIHGMTTPTRYVTVGGMAGDNITLSSSILRSSAIELIGSGIGSLPREAMVDFQRNILPEMFDLAATGKLKLEIVTASLADVEEAWIRHIPAGKRLVIVI